jgi:hypothetical protein
MIDIAGIGHASQYMNQQVGPCVSRRPQGRFLVRTVHRIVRLEGGHAAPAKAGEFVAQLRWRQP